MSARPAEAADKRTSAKVRDWPLPDTRVARQCASSIWPSTRTRHWSGNRTRLDVLRASSVVVERRIRRRRGRRERRRL